MRLNQATDYAFRMVLYLASLPAGTKMTGAALAEKQNIPERFLLKIMRSLTAAHIMKSSEVPIISGSFFRWRITQ